MPFIESMRPLTFTHPPPGVVLYQALDAVSQGKPLRIVETGCLRDTNISACFSDGWSTYYFARWVKANPESKLATVELDSANVETCRAFLAEHKLAVHFVNGDSLAELPKLEADVYFLDSCDGLEHGLAEFQIALAHRPRLIIMDDLPTKGLRAVEYAKELGIEVAEVSRYTFFNTEKYLQFIPE